MKTVKFCIFVLVSLFSINCFAQVASCPDADKDGYAVCSTTCNLSPGTKCGDCNDTPGAVGASTHPGATEVWEDDLDNDCTDDMPGQTKPDGSPANGDRRSMGAVIVARFAKGLNRNITPKSASELQLWKEWKVCKAAGANCVVDQQNGTIKAAANFHLIDTDCDGVFNVVPDSYPQTIGDKEKCDKAAKKKAAARATSSLQLRPRAPAPAGANVPLRIPTDATPVVAAPAPSSRLFSVVQKQAAAADQKADKALETANKASAKVDTFDGQLKALVEKDGVLDAALKAEESRAKAEEARIQGIAQAGLDRATEAKAEVAQLKGVVDGIVPEVGKARALAPLVELVLGGSLIGQSSLPVYDKPGGTIVGANRGYGAVGGNFGVNLGVETSGARINALGSVLALADQSGKGFSAGRAWNVGVESCAKISVLCVGGHVLFQEHSAGGTVTAAEAVSRGAGAGLTFRVGNNDSAGKAGLLVRLTGGYEVVGSKIVDNGSPFVGLSISGVFGLGRDNSSSAE